MQSVSVAKKISTMELALCFRMANGEYDDAKSMCYVHNTNQIFLLGGTNIGFANVFSSEMTTHKDSRVLWVTREAHDKSLLTVEAVLFQCNVIVAKAFVVYGEKEFLQKTIPCHITLYEHMTRDLEFPDLVPPPLFYKAHCRFETPLKWTAITTRAQLVPYAANTGHDTFASFLSTHVTSEKQLVLCNIGDGHRKDDMKEKELFGKPCEAYQYRH
eukprot:6183927-Pleurochrysis_carterae.AAC.1